MAKIMILLLRFNNKTLFYDKENTHRNVNYLMPIGMAYISAVLKREGHEVTCLNINHLEGHTHDIVMDEMQDKNYDFALLGGLSMHYPDIRDCVSYVREASPNTKIVVGGGIITSQPEIMFGLIKPDYIVIGEGEETVKELVYNVEHNIGLGGVNGIGYYGENNKLVITPSRKPIMDLDSLPLPDYEGIGYAEYVEKGDGTSSFLYDFIENPRCYTLISSRSCPYLCTFCYHPLGNVYRQRSVDNIMEELKTVIPKYKINMVNFIDELFLKDPIRVKEFCKKFKEYTDTLPWKIQWTCGMRVDGDTSLFPLMKEAGCGLASLGLESYSQTVLKSMKKHITTEQMKDTLIAIKKNDIGVQGNFIFGDTAETMETAKETLDFYKNNQDLLRGSISLHFIIPFQGSEIYKRCVADGKIPDELKFIEERAINGYDLNKPLNMTKMTDNEFETLKETVFSALYTSRKFVIPTKHEKSISVECPYCNQTFNKVLSLYPRWIEQTEMGCPHCHSRFTMVANNNYRILLWCVNHIGYQKMYHIKQKLKKLGIIKY